MSLVTDRIFFEALKRDDTLMAQVSGRIYNTAIPLPDVDAINAPVPYIIVKFDGFENDASTKDDPFEGDGDIVVIGIEAAAATREELATLMTRIRDVIHNQFIWALDYEEGDGGGDSFRDWVISSGDEVLDVVPYDYMLTGTAIQYDSLKPCYWQSLSYRCDTRR